MKNPRAYKLFKGVTKHACAKSHKLFQKAMKRRQVERAQRNA